MSNSRFSLFSAARNSSVRKMVPSQSESAAMIRALNDEYIDAARADDVSWFRDHMADECIVIQGTGRRLTKAEFVTRLVDAPTAYTWLTSHDVIVRVFGAVAQVDAHATWELANGSAGISRYIDTYLWVEGRWRVISAQVTWFPAD